MWNPRLYFEEVRRAWLPDHAQRFIVMNIYRARGTAEAPGPMAAIDRGGTGYRSLAFRIADAKIETGTDVLWQREGIGPGYWHVIVDARIGDEQITALTFIANHNADLIDSEMSRDGQIGYLVAGTSIDYLRNLVCRLCAVGIRDADVEDLLHDGEASFSETAWA
ncbi:Cation transport regulator ChaC [Jannaschia faecimaris]|uniref:Cation transport regulator ChaC n=1 Tax=Jannaschia faecimaris TaxID=1244108 RepID=A0A1H3PQB2_9RHOB|nr:gamma-glutamylcyclotransferase [Jannaschia faecimaris]SDZ02599.1 Cation transport regulator ChaC [Jannaschia faecimaris]